ncbi:MAG: choice-of-anchor D domain-containing protein, partial [Candidatus Binataceae bacterium]
NFGGFIALQNLLSGAAPPAIVSISFGSPETLLGAENSYISSLYQQAASEGVSVFVAAGDWGAAASDGLLGDPEALYGINVSGFASTPYDVAVGGTDFSDTYSGTEGTYWRSSNTANYGSALSYIPEIPWNDSCAGGLLDDFYGYPTAYGSSGFCNSSEGEDYFLNLIAGGGGPSGCATGAPSASGVVSGTCAGYAKPAWQSVFGNPQDGVRDLPDVSLFASNGFWRHFYVVCSTASPEGCSGAPDTWGGGGGTSFAAPIMAGIQALINQKTGSPQGNPNPAYYSLASAEYGASGSSICDSSLGNAVSSSCIFYDITLGDNDVPCIGSNNCYAPSGTWGVLSTSDSDFLPSFGTAAGWDFATGIGSINAYNLVNAFSPITSPTPTPTPTPTLTPTSTATPTPVAEKLTFSPSSLSFGDAVRVGTVSKPKAVTIKNPGSKKTGLAVNIQQESATALPFEVNSECETTLAPGKSCKVQVTFKPPDTTLQTGSLMIFDNATGSPQSVALSGTGKAPKQK